MLVISKSKVSGNTYYVGIPVGNADLMGKYYTLLDSLDSSILSAHTYVISAYLASAMNAANELEKGK